MSPGTTTWSCKSDARFALARVSASADMLAALVRWFGPDQFSASKIAYSYGHTAFRQWNKRPSQRSDPQLLRKGQFYYVEALMREAGGSDHLSVGVAMPDGSQSMPISAPGLLYKRKVELDMPRSMDLAPCAAQGEQCDFSSKALVQFSLGWDAIPAVYTVATDGVRCHAFGSGVGGEQYVHVATDRICAGLSAGAREESAPGHLGGDATDEEVVDDCKRKCNEREDCTHFVSWANQACFTYETCDTTDDGAAVDSTERVYVNVYRTKGKCEYGKSVAPGSKSMGWN